MIHLRKRLNLFDLIKAIFFFKNLKNLEWKKTIEQQSLVVSKSSWSILLIGLWIKKIKNKKPLFLVPDYYCNYTLNFLRILGAQIVFYPVNKNFEPIFDKIDSSITPDILIATHYFGKELDLQKITNYCNDKKIWLIEDATHCLKRTGNIGKYGHFLIFSQHKFFSNINGALLLINEKKLSNDEIKSFGDKKTWIKVLEKFIRDKNIKIYNNNFRIIINIIYDNFFKIFINDKIENFDNNDFNQSKYPGPSIDLISKKLFFYFSYKVEDISDYRKRCHLLVENILDDNFNKDDFEILSNTSFNPYFLVIKSNNKIKEIYNSLQSLGLVVQTWPDLPPETDYNSDANYLRNHLAFVPLNKISFDKIQLIKNLGDNLQVKFEECIDQKKWNFLSKDLEFNILQTWEFGNFKNRLPFVRTKRYIIRNQNEEEIAFLQVVNYYFLGINFFLINRGPVYNVNIGEEIKKNICQNIIFHFKKDFLSFLFFKPELNFNKKNIFFQFNNKNFYLNKPFWVSSKINLKINDIDIFQNFKSTLRNEIIKAKKLLQIETVDQKKNTEWIIKNYFSTSNKKKFKTINKNLINFLDPQKIISMCATKDKKICSGILFYCHGNVATYLLSYNSDIGRKNYGNQILLWEMIKYLKKINYNHLDLGGIDNNQNLKVAKFKLAFGGELYKLIGTILK